MVMMMTIITIIMHTALMICMCSPLNWPQIGGPLIVCRTPERRNTCGPVGADASGRLVGQQTDLRHLRVGHSCASRVHCEQTRRDYGDWVFGVCAIGYYSPLECGTRGVNRSMRFRYTDTLVGHVQ